jgi:hypothetical protein
MRQLIADAFEFPESVAVGEPKREIQSLLTQLATAASSENWDGMGSAPVEHSTYSYALELLRMLPTTLPHPDVSLDSDGEISFEWDRGPRNVFSVSVGRDGTLTYAGLFGSKKMYGTELLDEVLPYPVALGIHRVTANG